MNNIKDMELLSVKNGLTFSEAEKEIEKYTIGYNWIVNKSIEFPNGKDVLIYEDKKTDDIINVICQYDYKNNTYDIKICKSLLEKNIKLTLVNNDTITTKIRGTEKQIISHYNDNNFLSNCIDTNIKEIQFNINNNIKIYNFEYDKKAECYLY